MTSTRYVALLRGINIGRAKQVAMADLRDLLVDLGYSAVQTHLRSGNAVFTAAGTAEARLAEEIEQAIADRLGMQVSVVVRDRADLDRVVKANPLALDGRDPARLFVVFLSAAPSPASLALVDPAAYLPEEFAVGDQEIYLWLPEGMWRSVLGALRWDRVAGKSSTGKSSTGKSSTGKSSTGKSSAGKSSAGAPLIATARNWRTTLALRQMLDD